MQRRDAIREAFVHSWTAYERFAWGHDELQPLTNTSNDVWGGFAVTMIDCLDTAKIMGLHAEFERMVAFLDTNFTMQRDHYVSVFELSIRVLGGLLALLACHLLFSSGVFARKITSHGDRIALGC